MATTTMNGLWVWPADENTQAKTLQKLRENSRLIEALSTLEKKDGLSNAQLDISLNDNSQWQTLWTLRQLTALGFIEYKVNIFGDSGKYFLTELGKIILQKLSGKPAKPIPSPITPAPTKT